MSQSTPQYTCVQRKRALSTAYLYFMQLSPIKWFEKLLMTRNYDLLMHHLLHCVVYFVSLVLTLESLWNISFISNEYVLNHNAIIYTTYQRILSNNFFDKFHKSDLHVMSFWVYSFMCRMMLKREYLVTFKVDQTHIWCWRIYEVLYRLECPLLKTTKFSQRSLSL